MNIRQSPRSEQASSLLDNRAALEQAGVDVFPAAGYRPTHRISDMPAVFNQQCDRRSDEPIGVRVAGRVTGLRRHGKSLFGNLTEQQQSVQFHVSFSDVSETCWFVSQHLDLGDWIGIDGTLFNTRRGELTLRVETLTMLGKPITPPALGKTADGKVHQAQADTGALLRDRRHILLHTDEDVAANLRARAAILREFRHVMEQKGYLELTTAIVSPFYGGAAATPFTTQCKGNGKEMYLRISPELDLKRALCAGFPAVYEIGPQFRNEGIDATHQPVFTSFECYHAYQDYYDMMELVEELVRAAAIAVHGNERVRINGEIYDFSLDWPRFDMLQLVARELKIDRASLSYDDMSAYWDREGLGADKPATWGEILVEIFEAKLEAGLRGPCHVINHPHEVSPLTKRHRDDPRLTERFESYVDGIEIANAYSELNDPVEQRHRLMEQDLEREEVYGVDDYFLAAIEDGMPQAGGLGIGFDRIVMLLRGASRINDVIAFPIA